MPLEIKAHSRDWGPATNKVWLKLDKDILLLSGEPTDVKAI